MARSMTDNASRVCGGRCGWRVSACDLKFPIDMESADSGREAKRGWELLGVLLLGARPRAMLDPDQDGVNEISMGCSPQSP